MNFREFKRADNVQISDWFADEESRVWLESALSEEELDEVERELDHRSFVLEDGDLIIAQVGCYLGNEEHQFNVISEVHVAPRKRKMGYGILIIKKMIEEIKNQFPWKVYIEPENTASVALFTSLGWRAPDPRPNEQNLVTYVTTSIAD